MWEDFPPSATCLDLFDFEWVSFLHFLPVLFILQRKISLTTAPSCMEDRCPGCLGASTEISQPLDSETLPWLAIPATQPWAPTSSHPGTCHTEKKQWKWGRGGGRAKENRQENSKLSYKNRFDTPRWNTLQRWGALSLPCPQQTADRLTNTSFSL